MSIPSKGGLECGGGTGGIKPDQTVEDDIKSKLTLGGVFDFQTPVEFPLRKEQGGHGEREPPRFTPEGVEKNMYVP